MKKPLFLITLWISIALGTAQAKPLDDATSARLNHFIASIQSDITGHHWESLLAKADAEHYNEQRQHVDRWQYIAGQLGIDYRDNHIAGGGKITEDALAQIKTVQVLSVTGEELVTIEGRIDLFDGRSLKMTIIVIFKNDRFQISGAFG